MAAWRQAALTFLIMKALLLYTTAIITVIILSTGLSLTWLALVMLDMVLIALCLSNISFDEFIKYSGYKHWYKLLNN